MTRCHCACCASGVEAGHETGSARGANRALTVGVSESGAPFDKGVNGRSLCMGVAQCPDGVKALLIGTIPEDVRFLSHHRLGGII